MKNKKKSGAASVLVVFMMLVLVTLGAFAIASSNANFRLSRRAVSWNEMFYDLDSLGETYLSQIDARLAEAEASAGDFVANKRWQVDSAENDLILDGYFWSLDDDEELFNHVFIYFSNLNLINMSFAQSDFNVYNNEGFLTSDTLTLTLTIMSEKEGFEECGLRVELEVDPVANRGKRYEVRSWYEFQGMDFDEAGLMGEVWDGGMFTFD